MSSVSPQVSQRLEETSAALQDAVAQVEQLTVTNSRLGAGRGTHGGVGMGARGEAGAAPRAHSSAPADLGTLMKQLASAQQERDALQQETTDQKEEISRWVPHPFILPLPSQIPKTPPGGPLTPIPSPSG